MGKFNVGDKVTISEIGHRRNTNIRKHSKGVIVHILAANNVGVVWEHILCGHNLNNHISSNHGWYVTDKDIILTTINWKQVIEK